MRSVFALAILFATAGVAHAQPKQAAFALIIGVNQSVDRDLPVLHYADDDAARYQDLFRAIGTRTYLLSRLDENTRRVHPQVAAEAREPNAQELNRVLDSLHADVEQARLRGIATVFYFIYAGHGSISDGHGYISLEDSKITGEALEQLIDRVGAKQSHVIIDACYSYFLAFGRGPGGERRPLSGFASFGQLSARKDIGLLLSTSSARESHEWEGFQAGVFSQEVRSGLYGAADVDGDGFVSYREIAAFVSRANAAIANEKYRPDVYARAPRQTDKLLDLRAGLDRRLEIPAAAHAHYMLEDSRGVRWADFHNGANQAVNLIRPAVAGPLYLRRMSDEQEFLIPPSPAVVKLAELEPSPPRALSRGAAHEAFSQIFSLPFDLAAAQKFDMNKASAPAQDERRRDGKRIAAWSLIGVGGAAFVAAALLETIRPVANAGDSQVSIVQKNQQINRQAIGADVMFGVASAAAVSAAVLLLLPHTRTLPTLTIAPAGGMVSPTHAF